MCAHLEVKETFSLSQLSHETGSTPLQGGGPEWCVTQQRWAKGVLRSGEPEGLEKQTKQWEPHPSVSQGLPAWNVSKMYLKFKNKNLISLQERFIICLTVLQHSVYSWSILLATETWGAGRDALDIKKTKNSLYWVSWFNIQSCCENQVIHLEKDPWMILVPDILFAEGQGGWLGNKGKYTVIFLGILG